MYEYAANLGCWVTLYQAKKPLTRLKAAFDRPNFVFDRKPFESLELLTAHSAAAIDAWIRRAHVPHERSRAPYLIAERLRLPRYAWLSYLAEQTKSPPDAQRIEVQANGTVKRPPKPVAPHVATPSEAKAPPKKKKAAAKKKTATKKPSKRSR